MAESIDELNIQIQADTSKASASISRLINRLDRLDASLNKIDTSKLTNSLQGISGAVSGITTNSLSQLTKVTTRLNKLSNINASGIANTAKALSGFTGSLNKLNVGTRSTGGGARISSSLSGIKKSAGTSTKSVKSLAAAFGKFYASYFLVIRGVKKLWSSIGSSMDVIETINYFNNAFEQVASIATNDWKDLGYNSAEAYYKSFAERAQELTGKMTGFAMNDKGALSSTGSVNLGLNPEKLMNYQSVFAQMSSSMGVSAEIALKLSQALTEIGADLASVKNLEFEAVWSDMASGLAGMSRTLDKYGVNIRNVNLQQKLNELGIQANIQNLNQNDKALLRTIILLDTTQYAWADLAETLNQPANQLRMLKGNMNNLARTIGGIFLPIVQKTLPYINGLVIALQRLAQWVSDLLGFGKIDWGGSASGGSDYLSDIYDQTEDVSSGLGDATASAKKLKQQLQGFDELNVLTTPSDTEAGTGSNTVPPGLLDNAFLDAFSRYQTEWDKAFSNLSSKAQGVADKIEKYFAPVKKLIADVFAGDWFAAGQDVTGIVTGITDAFTRAVEKVDWRQIGDNIGKFVSGIDWTEILKSVGKLIWKALGAGVELWEGAFDAAPIETGIVTAVALLKWTGLGGSLTTSLGNVAIGETTFGALIKKVASGLGAAVLTAVVGFNIGQKLYEVITGEVIELDWKEQFGQIFQSFKDGTWVDAFKLWGEDINSALYDITDRIDSVLGNATLGAIDKVKGFLSGISRILKQSWENIKLFFTQIFTKIITIFAGYGEAMLNNVKDIISDIKRVFNGIVSFVTGVFTGNWSKAWQGVVDVFGGIFDTLYDVAKVPLNLVIGLINTVVSAVETGLNAMINAVNGINIKVPDWVPGIGGTNYGFAIPTVSLGRVQYFERGGYPSRSSLFFAGENGIPELLGTVGGKTAVASGTEITGISDAIRNTSAEEVELLRQQNQLLRQILQKDTGISDSDIFKSVRRSDSRYRAATGVSAFG